MRKRQTKREGRDGEGENGETEQREKVRRGETTWALPFEEPLRLGFHLAADDSRCGVTSLSSPPEGSAPLQPPVHTPPSHWSPGLARALGEEPLRGGGGCLGGAPSECVDSLPGCDGFM